MIECFTNKKYFVQCKHVQTKIVNSLFLIKTPILVRFQKIIVSIYWFSSDKYKKNQRIEIKPRTRLFFFSGKFKIHLVIPANIYICMKIDTVKKN